MGQDASRVKIAADFIKQSEAIFIGAGAGMGVDSGLPDFLTTEYWNATVPFIICNAAKGAQAFGKLARLNLKLIH